MLFQEWAVVSVKRIYSKRKTNVTYKVPIDFFFIAKFSIEIAGELKSRVFSRRQRVNYYF